MDENGLERDEAAFKEYGQALQHAVSSAIRPWLRSLLQQRLGLDGSMSEMAQLVDVVAEDVESSIALLVSADVDEPLSGPLERIRVAMGPVTAALDAAGAERPSRDPVDREMRPDDHHSLGPMTYRDLGDDVHDAGIAWGAAKAHLHLHRRRRPDTSGG